MTEVQLASRIAALNAKAKCHKKDRWLAESSEQASVPGESGMHSYRHEVHDPECDGRHHVAVETPPDVPRSDPVPVIRGRLHGTD